MADPSSVTAVLQSVFRTDTRISISADAKNRAILAVAPAEQQKIIQQVVEQVEASSGQSALSTKVYYFKNASTYVAYQAVKLGLKPLAVGLFSAVLVGLVSFVLVSVIY